MTDARVASRRSTGSSSGGDQGDDDDDVDFEPLEDDTRGSQSVALRRSEHDASAV